MTDKMTESGIVRNGIESKATEKEFLIGEETRKKEDAWKNPYTFGKAEGKKLIRTYTFETAQDQCWKRTYIFEAVPLILENWFPYSYRLRLSEVKGESLEPSHLFKRASRDWPVEDVERCWYSGEYFSFSGYHSNGELGRLYYKAVLLSEGAPEAEYNKDGELLTVDKYCPDKIVNKAHLFAREYLKSGNSEPLEFRLIETSSIIK